jgi:hypothetical protein
MKKLLNYLMLLAVFLLSEEGISSVYASEVEDSLSGTKTENVGHPGSSTQKEEGKWEIQYTRTDADGVTGNSLLLISRDNMGMKNGLIEVGESGDSLRCTSAYRFDWGNLQLKGFLGSKYLDDPSKNHFGGAQARAKIQISDGMEGRFKVGYERSSDNDKKTDVANKTSALFGCGQLKIKNRLPVNLELTGGIGEVSEEGSERNPYGFQVIVGKDVYGLGLGLTKTDDELNSTTRNLAVFRYASRGPNNKYPDFFFFLRDNPELEKSLKLFGLYYGLGVDGSWQLVEPAVYGISNGMVERTLAHPDTYIGNVARFSDLGQFSRDHEDGTVVIIGADFQQNLGDGLKVAAREMDVYYTLHKNLYVISNPHIGLGVSEVTNPAFNPKTHSMGNEKTQESHLMLGFDLLGEYMKKNGLRLGVSSNLTFDNDGVDNNLALYLKGLRFF